MPFCSQLTALLSLCFALSYDRVHCAPAARAALKQRWGGQSIRALSVSLSAATKINKIELEMRSLRAALRCTRHECAAHGARVSMHDARSHRQHDAPRSIPFGKRRDRRRIWLSVRTSMRTDDDDDGREWAERAQSTRRSFRWIYNLIEIGQCKLIEKCESVCVREFCANNLRKRRSPGRENKCFQLE